MCHIVKISGVNQNIEESFNNKTKAEDYIKKWVEEYQKKSRCTVLWTGNVFQTTDENGNMITGELIPRGSQHSSE